MPKFGQVNERRNQLHEVIRLSGINIPINNNDHPLVIKVASLQPSRIQVYFVDNDDYFTKSADDADVLGSNRKDNDERAMYFAHGTADTVKKLKWEPAVVHISGWIASLLPLYVRNLYANDTTYLKTKLIYSVLPDEISGGIDENFFKKLKDEGFRKEVLEKYQDKKLNTNLFHYMAIDNADGVIFHTPEPPEPLLRLAKEKNIPVLMLGNAEEDVTSVVDFFKKITDEA